jgi:hypothetical protein
MTHNNRNYSREVAQWLMTMPGPIKGPTRADVLAQAYELVHVRFPGETPEEQHAAFEVCLKMLGHQARTRDTFDAAGNPASRYWELPLPEAPVNG